MFNVLYFYKQASQAWEAGSIPVFRSVSFIFSKETTHTELSLFFYQNVIKYPSVLCFSHYY